MGKDLIDLSEKKATKELEKRPRHGTDGDAQKGHSEKAKRP